MIRISVHVRQGVRVGRRKAVASFQKRRLPFEDAKLALSGHAAIILITSRQCDFLLTVIPEVK